MSQFRPQACHIVKHDDPVPSMITLAVMGTLTIEGGAITVWRDYFDPADFDRQLAGLQK
jgi:limonene-1,2-epoxide hydrolase